MLHRRRAGRTACPPPPPLDGRGNFFRGSRRGAVEILPGLTISVGVMSQGWSAATTFHPERDLVAAALRGEGGAAVALSRAAADVVWTACLRVTRERCETEAAFRAVMASLRADRFARLRLYDGRAGLRVYIGLVARDLLAERVVKLLALDADRGWRAFEAFFSEDMRRIILRMLPGPEHRQNREDAYQCVCEALLRNDLQRLRAYSGRGSPSGFVLHVIENLAIDYVRTILPRRRLPAAVQRSAELDQAVFRLVYWDRLAPEPTVLLNRLARSDPPPTHAAVAKAIGRVRAALPPGYRAETAGTVDISAAEEAALAGGAEDFAVPTPEDKLVEAERAGLLEQALAALLEALPRLETAERLYLQLAIAGHPARDIARLLGLPVETVHKLAQKTKRRLREEIGEEEAVKKWKLSV